MANKWPPGGKVLDLSVDVNAKEFLDRARGIGITQSNWPYGANIDMVSRIKMVEWAEHRGLKLSGAYPCLHWLEHGRCMERGICRYHHWMDHITPWNFEGKPALLLSHPYSLHDDDIIHLAGLAADGYDISMEANHWYGHDSIGIELWVPEQRKKSQDFRHAA